MERERAITWSTRQNYNGMKTGLAERVSGVGWSGPVRFGPDAPRHPEEVDEPFTETFRGLLALLNWVKGRLGVGEAAVGVPLTLLGPCGSCGCGDWAGVPGLGRDEDVDGAPAGLPALSLAESLSGPDLPALFCPSCCAWLTFIFLQFGRTRYLRGNGPFCDNSKGTTLNTNAQLLKSNHQCTNKNKDICKLNHTT